MQSTFTQTMRQAILKSENSNLYSLKLAFFQLSCFKEYYHNVLKDSLEGKLCILINDLHSLIIMTKLGVNTSSLNTKILDEITLITQATNFNNAFVNYDKHSDRFYEELKLEELKSNLKDDLIELLETIAAML